ncbi:MAG: hypothetical protein K6F94_06760 [Bacteroidaceae bacterium]|nr:hypothetical protein [Bacteroidaceae bacterium]
MRGAKAMGESIRNLVLVPLGGLCNRLRAIMSAIQLAKDTGAPLTIIWLRDKGLNARFSDLFQPLPAIESVSCSIIESGAWYFYGVPRLRNLYLPSLLQINAYDTLLNEERIAKIMRSVPEDNLSEAIQKQLRGSVFIQTGLEFYSTDDRQFLNLFRPTEAIGSIIAERTKRIDRHTIGIHVRRTDNELSASHSPLSAFEAAMKEDLTRDPEASFYLATDDVTVQTELSKSFPTCFWSQTSPTRSTQQGMQEAVAELFTLITCPRFHGSYWSSFSDRIKACHNEGEADIICTDA